MHRQRMEALKIWLLCIFAALAYGVVHDQITARICVEYFSIAHPTILPLTSPTLLALQWGILATWWVGAALGILLATAARVGSRPKLEVRDLRRPIAVLLVFMVASATISGLCGYRLARSGIISLPGWLASAMPANKHARFMADWWAHSASYAAGIVGGLAVCGQAWRRRKRC